MRLAILPIATLPLLSACLFDDAPESLRVTGETMGTTFSVSVVDPPEGTTEAGLLDRIETVLADVNGKMSNWDPNSEVSLFNAATTTEPVAISPDLAFVMDTANTVHALSDGRFDVTLAPLIDLWGFGPARPGDAVPDDDAIAAALQHVGQSELLALGDGTLEKSDPAVTVNLSAIAKGYGTDRIAGALRHDGIDRYLVEIGGDMVAHGINADGVPWQIGIERPDAAGRSVERLVGLSDHGMATSGDYRNYFEADGVRYSHIIDPVTGRPVTHRTASVTVIADDGMRADALATALLVLGGDAAMDVAERENLAVFLIERDGDTFVTRSSAAFEALIDDTDTD